MAREIDPVTEIPLLSKISRLNLPPHLMKQIRQHVKKQKNFRNPATVRPPVVIQRPLIELPALNEQETTNLNQGELQQVPAVFHPQVPSNQFLPSSVNSIKGSRFFNPAFSVPLPQVPNRFNQVSPITNQFSQVPQIANQFSQLPQAQNQFSQIPQAPNQFNQVPQNFHQSQFFHPLAQRSQVFSQPGTQQSFSQFQNPGQFHQGFSVFQQQNPHFFSPPQQAVNIPTSPQHTTHAQRVENSPFQFRINPTAIQTVSSVHTVTETIYIPVEEAKQDQPVTVAAVSIPFALDMTPEPIENDLSLVTEVSPVTDLGKENSIPSIVNFPNENPVVDHNSVDDSFPTAIDTFEQSLVDEDSISDKTFHPHTDNFLETTTEIDTMVPTENSLFGNIADQASPEQEIINLSNSTIDFTSKIFQNKSEQNITTKPFSFDEAIALLEQKKSLETNAAKSIASMSSINSETINSIQQLDEGEKVSSFFNDSEIKDNTEIPIVNHFIDTQENKSGIFYIESANAEAEELLKTESTLNSALQSTEDKLEMTQSPLLNESEVQPRTEIPIIDNFFNMPENVTNNFEEETTTEEIAEAGKTEAITTDIPFTTFDDLPIAEFAQKVIDFQGEISISEPQTMKSIQNDQKTILTAINSIDYFQTESPELATVTPASYSELSEYIDDSKLEGTSVNLLDELETTSSPILKEEESHNLSLNEDKIPFSNVATEFETTSKSIPEEVFTFQERDNLDKPSQESHIIERTVISISSSVNPNPTTKEITIFPNANSNTDSKMSSTSFANSETVPTFTIVVNPKTGRIFKRSTTTSPSENIDSVISNIFRQRERTFTPLMNDQEPRRQGLFTLFNQQRGSQRKITANQGRSISNSRTFSIPLQDNSDSPNKEQDKPQSPFQKRKGGLLQRLKNSRRETKLKTNTNSFSRRIGLIDSESDTQTIGTENKPVIPEENQHLEETSTDSPVQEIVQVTPSRDSITATRRQSLKEQLRKMLENKSTQDKVRRRILAFRRASAEKREEKASIVNEQEEQPLENTQSKQVEPSKEVTTKAPINRFSRFHNRLRQQRKPQVQSKKKDDHEVDKTKKQTPATASRFNRFRNRPRSRPRDEIRRQQLETLTSQLQNRNKTEHSPSRSTAFIERNTQEPRSQSLPIRRPGNTRFQQFSRRNNAMRSRFNQLKPEFQSRFSKQTPSNDITLSVVTAEMFETTDSPVATDSSKVTADIFTTEFSVSTIKNEEESDSSKLFLEKINFAHDTDNENILEPNTTFLPEINLQKDFVDENLTTEDPVVEETTFWPPDEFHETSLQIAEVKSQEEELQFQKDKKADMILTLFESLDQATATEQDELSTTIPSVMTHLSDRLKSMTPRKTEPIDFYVEETTPEITTDKPSETVSDLFSQMLMSISRPEALRPSIEGHHKVLDDIEPVTDQNKKQAITSTPKQDSDSTTISEFMHSLKSVQSGTQAPNIINVFENDPSQEEGLKVDAITNEIAMKTEGLRSITVEQDLDTEYTTLSSVLEETESPTFQTELIYTTELPTILSNQTRTHDEQIHKTFEMLGLNDTEFSKIRNESPSTNFSLLVDELLLQHATIQTSRNHTSQEPISLFDIPIMMRVPERVFKVSATALESEVESVSFDNLQFKNETNFDDSSLIVDDSIDIVSEDSKINIPEYFDETTQSVLMSDIENISKTELLDPFLEINKFVENSEFPPEIDQSPIIEADNFDPLIPPLVQPKTFLQTPLSALEVTEEQPQLQDIPIDLLLSTESNGKIISENKHPKNVFSDLFEETTSLDLKNTEPDSHVHESSKKPSSSSDLHLKDDVSIDAETLLTSFDISDADKTSVVAKINESVFLDEADVELFLPSFEFPTTNVPSIPAEINDHTILDVVDGDNATSLPSFEIPSNDNSPVAAEINESKVHESQVEDFIRKLPAFIGVKQGLIDAQNKQEPNFESFVETLQDAINDTTFSPIFDTVQVTTPIPATTPAVKRNLFETTVSASVNVDDIINKFMENLSIISETSPQPLNDFIPEFDEIFSAQDNIASRSDNIPKLFPKEIESLNPSQISTPVTVNPIISTSESVQELLPVIVESSVPSQTSTPATIDTSPDLLRVEKVNDHLTFENQIKDRTHIQSDTKRLVAATERTVLAKLSPIPVGNIRRGDKLRGKSVLKPSPIRPIPVPSSSPIRSSISTKLDSSVATTNDQRKDVNSVSSLISENGIPVARKKVIKITSLTLLTPSPPLSPRIIPFPRKLVPVPLQMSPSFMQTTHKKVELPPISTQSVAPETSFQAPPLTSTTNKIFIDEGLINHVTEADDQGVESHQLKLSSTTELSPESTLETTSSRGIQNIPFQEKNEINRSQKSLDSSTLLNKLNLEDSSSKTTPETSTSSSSSTTSTTTANPSLVNGFTNDELFLLDILADIVETTTMKSLIDPPSLEPEQESVTSSNTQLLSTTTEKSQVDFHFKTPQFPPPSPLPEFPRMPRITTPTKRNRIKSVTPPTPSIDRSFTVRQPTTPKPRFSFTHEFPFHVFDSLLSDEPIARPRSVSSRHSRNSSNRLSPNFSFFQVFNPPRAPSATDSSNFQSNLPPFFGSSVVPSSAAKPPSVLGASKTRPTTSKPRARPSRQEARPISTRLKNSRPKVVSMKTVSGSLFFVTEDQVDQTMRMGLGRPVVMPKPL